MGDKRKMRSFSCAPEPVHKILSKAVYNFVIGTCEASRFDSNQPFRFDSKVMGRFDNFRMARACSLLVVVKRLKPLTALSGTVYRLASSMSDHTPVLFNVFKDWNEKSIVPHISFDLIRIRFERKRPIRRYLVLSSIYGRFDSRFDSFKS